jgi:hypothetical protein
MTVSELQRFYPCTTPKRQPRMRIYDPGVTLSDNCLLLALCGTVDHFVTEKPPTLRPIA